MKKWLLWIVLFLLLGIVAIQQLQEYKDGGYKTENSEVQQGPSGKSGNAIKVTKGQIYKGDLLLVNRDYPVHEQGVKSDVVNLFEHQELVEGYGLLNNKIRLSQSVAEKFLKMMDAAEKDGVDHFLISSGYRTAEEQRELYHKMGSDTALPANYSEHNLGMSLDIGSTKQEMSKAAEGKWLKKNAWRYGFILRYPEDKTNITGIKYEPWHFRYVGLPQSVIMQEKGFTLEEYIDYLRETKHISTTIHGKEYEVTYYPVGKKKTIQIPANRRFDISGNNVDGVIVTVYPK